MVTKGNITQKSKETMSRVVFNQHGGPEVLNIVESDIPKPKKGQVLVKNLATSINGGDADVRKGTSNKLFNKLTKFPKAIGQDVVGRVEQLGEGVTNYQVGDMVWGNTTTSSNATAEYVAISTKKISFMPSNISAIEAASYPCAAITAIVSLIDKGQLKKGQKVLIRGVGGVGFFATQIAHIVGAHVTVLGSKSTVRDMKNYGADEIYDYRETAIEALGQYDLIFDTVGTMHEQLRNQLKKQGKLLTISISMKNIIEIIKSIRYGVQRSRLVIAFPNPKNLSHLAELVKSGKIKTNINAVYKMDQIVEAYQHSEKRGVFGKIIIDLDRN